MATVHSTRTCLPKLACSALVVGLFTAGILITGAYPHQYLSDRLFNLGGHNQTNSTTSEHSTYQSPIETNSSAQLEVLQSNNQALQTQLEQALARIEQNVQKNKEFAERISRSPRAIKTIQALEAAIAILGQNEHKAEYEVSEYATGNRRWKHSPAVHPVPIQDLLLYNVQNKHNQNKILGDKVVQVV
jgi:predicted RNase H-like nuclease (RuvC/YqgF family)